MSLIGKKGVDIGDHNGDVDFGKLKAAGFAFIMIKCGYGSDHADQDDCRFEENVKKAEKAGMPWGAWLYSYALNEDQARSELAHILRLLKGKKPTMPIALDVEDSDDYRKNHGGWNYENVTACTRIVLDGLRKAGYYPMLYTGFDEIENYIASDVWKNVDLWFAHWARECGYKGENLAIWQYGGEENYIDTPYIDGVSGKIDKDLCYRDYPTIIKDGGYNGWQDASCSAPVTQRDGTPDNALTCVITLPYLAQEGFTSKGAAVKTVQRLLNATDYLGADNRQLSVDGIFGVNTDHAVRLFQKHKALTADGIVGVKTWKALLKAT